MSTDTSGTNTSGEPTYNVGLTERELTELIWLIDDEPVDEEFLAGIRKKLALKRKRLQKRQDKPNNEQQDVR